MRKAVTMNHLVKLFVLAQVLANAACELVEPEISIPVEVTQMIGTWDYAASFVAATTVVGASVTCVIAGVTITAGNPLKTARLGIYGFDAEASGGAVECTGDGTDDFVQELPAHVAVELQRSPCCWVDLNLTFPTPLGLMQVRNHANVFVWADDSISADYWNGGVVATVEPVMEFPFNSRGRFIAVRRTGGAPS